MLVFIELLNASWNTNQESKSRIRGKTIQTIPCSK